MDGGGYSGQRALSKVGGDVLFDGEVAARLGAVERVVRRTAAGWMY